jgi:hypothetical protein
MPANATTPTMVTGSKTTLVASLNFSLVVRGAAA